MKRILTILMLAFVLTMGVFSQDLPDIDATKITELQLQKYTGDMPNYYGYVEDVADGDTFYVDWYTEDRMGIRVYGVDTPETKDARKTVQYWGPEASKFSHDTLKKGTLVCLDFRGNITGPFGRLLAHTYYWDGTKWHYWEKELLENGMAFVYWRYEFDNPDELLKYQQYAIDNKKGMWAHPELIENEVVTSSQEFYNKASWYRKLHPEMHRTDK